MYKISRFETANFLKVLITLTQERGG